MTSHKSGSNAGQAGNTPANPANDTKPSSGGGASPTHFFQQASAAGATIQLTNNWRSHGIIAQFPSAQFYNGKMTTPAEIAEHPMVSVFEERINAILLQAMGIASENLPVGNSWVIDMPKSQATIVGKSYTNVEQVLFATELVHQLFRIGLPHPEGPRYTDVPASPRLADILILAPYTATVTSMRRALEKVPSSFIDHSLVECRTFGEARGAEADIVIIVHTHLDETGFGAQVGRLSVAMTRARFAQIFVTNSKAWEGMDENEEVRIMRAFLDSARKRSALLST